MLSNSTNRRVFLQGASAAAIAVGVSGSVLAADPAEKAVVAVIGTGGMGTGHVRTLSARNDVEIAWLCDVDEKRLASAAEVVKQAKGKSPQITRDLRQVLDDKTVDAVWIATPDHWHTPAALLALNAGKHVYVEKPCSHNIREGRLLVDAAQRTGKVVQVGTQSRSTACVQDGIQRVLNGDIGDVLISKAWNSQLRGTIGKSQPGMPPANLDYDTWLGPAPAVPYRPNLLPGVWRWWYDFGCGDIGNDGVHDIDVALWGLGVTTHPHRVSCFGTKLFFDDDQQFPDSQYSVCEYAPDPKTGKKKQFIFEQRIWSPYLQEGYENGAAFYGTKGVLIMGHTIGWKLFGPRNKLIAERTGSADLAAHHTNFLDCIRGKVKQTNAHPMVGHLAATIVHLSNIAARVDSVLHFNPETEQISNHEAAAMLVKRKYREGHWSVPKDV
ncbi:MAG: nagA 1 [Planctomycetaceae bacterium]|nr:nagA 1 [Planctomycetaceae bacterium]